MAETRKYEVIHRIRIERRKTLKVGAVVELNGAQAAEFAHAIRLLPTEEASISSQEQAPQPEAPAATEDGAEAEVARGETQGASSAEEEALAGTETSEGTQVEGDNLRVSDKARVTPGAEAEAKKLGIALGHVKATGSGNTLTKKDVQREAARIKREQE